MFFNLFSQIPFSVLKVKWVIFTLTHAITSSPVDVCALFLINKTSKLYTVSNHGFLVVPRIVGSEFGWSNV